MARERVKPVSTFRDVDYEKVTKERYKDFKDGYNKAVDKACLEYEKELRQMKRILNEIKDGAGEIICISGSLIQFRKALEE